MEFDDIVLSVVDHYPAYPLDKALETESLVISLLFMRIPGIHHRDAWPFVQLLTFLGNALGGKGKEGKAPEPGSTWSPEEFLPMFQVRDLNQLPKPALEPQHCYAFERARAAGHFEDASWVFQFLNRVDSLTRIEQVAEGYAGLLENDACVSSDEAVTATG